MFEAQGLVKPLFWVVALQALFYVIVLRPWRVRDLARALSPGIDLFAVLLVLLAILALGTPEPFDRAAAWLIERTSLPDSIAMIDIELAELEQLPERLWAELKATFGFDGPAPPAGPPMLLERPGAVEAAVVGAVEEVVSIVMRAYVYLTCVVTLWLAALVRIFMRSVTARLLRDERLLSAVAGGGGAAASPAPEGADG